MGSAFVTCSLGAFPARSSVLRGRASGHGLEIADEVRLIEVAERHREIRPVDRLALLQPFDRFVQPIAVDDPLRTHADVLAEQALQRPHGETPALGDLLDAHQAEIRGDVVHDGADPRDLRVLRRPVRAEEALGGRDHGVIVRRRRRNLRFQRVGRCREEIGRAHV